MWQLLIGTTLVILGNGWPGFSMITLIHEFQSQWKKSFTVVH